MTASSTLETVRCRLFSAVDRFRSRHGHKLVMGNMNGTTTNILPVFELEEYQKTLLRLTWSDDFDFLYQLGADIYEVIFIRAPDSKNLFPSLTKYGDNWRESKEFRSQALKFVQVIAHAIKNLQRPEALEPMLRQVGKMHRKYAERGFKPEYWDVFQEAIEVAMKNHINKNLENRVTPQEKIDAIETWKVLAIYLVSRMRQGFAE